MPLWLFGFWLIPAYVLKLLSDSDAVLSHNLRLDTGYFRRTGNAFNRNYHSWQPQPISQTRCLDGNDEKPDPLNKCRIFVCYAETGGGHIYAASAIRDALEELIKKDPQLPEVEIVLEAIVRQSNFLNHLFVELYNYLLRNRQDWIKYYSWFIESLKPNQTMLGYKACQVYLNDLLLRIQPTLCPSSNPSKSLTIENRSLCQLNII